MNISKLIAGTLPLLITSLRAQEKLLEDVFKKFKLTIPATEE